MNWILVIILLICTVLNFKISGKLILHPTVLVSSMFTLSALMLALNSQWKYTISFETCAFLFFALTAFTIGVSFASRLKTPKSMMPQIERLGYEISKPWIFLFSCICLVVTYVYAKHQYVTSIALGNTFGWVGVIFTLRKAVNTNVEVFELNATLNMGISFCRALAYCSLFLLIADLFNKRKTWKRYVIPILCMLINIVLSTGRGGFICFIVTVIFDLYIISYIHYQSNINKKMIKYSIMGVSVFLVLFVFIGNFTGASEAFSVWDTFSIYIGSSILCLDDMLLRGGSTSEYFALHTFKGMYTLLGRFIPSLPHLSNHAEMVRWSDYSSNVYTSFAPYLRDFGVIGAIFFVAFIGVVFGYFWKWFKNANEFSIIWVIYGRYFGYALCMFSIAERLCSEFLALNVFVELILYYILIKFYFKRVIMN